MTKTLTTLATAAALALWVRVHPKSGVSKFFRCGTQFGPDWQAVEVDEATAARLQAEQMLEVTDTDPNLPEPKPNEADPSGGSGDGSGSATPATAPAGSPAAPTVPQDPAERLVAIRAAMGQLNKDDDSLWTAGGKPKTDAIAALTGWPVSAAERDAATDGEAQ